MKLSETQVEVLTHMAAGHKLYRAYRSPWLDGVPGKHRGLNLRVRGSTLWVLLERGLIERADTEQTPYYRRDYVITEAGREALEENKL